MAETAENTEQQQAQDAGTQGQSAELSEATEGNSSGQGASVDILLDMDVPITVAIGQTEISVQQLLQLAPGAVLKLDKPIDMPADLYLKDTKFATGNIIVVEDRFAVRIKEIIGVKAATATATATEAEATQ
ncbi:MAG: FliM/FliN family flagellar motor switch protein [Anaerohalosphaeraceae bacterium]|nr:FliM/FliN family flagellar motor switch protein [Anaerohalosphaeraceae bacterium]